jgi:hypothetical protein
VTFRLLVRVSAERRANVKDEKKKSIKIRTDKNTKIIRMSLKHEADPVGFLWKEQQDIDETDRQRGREKKIIQ